MEGGHDSGASERILTRGDARLERPSAAVRWPDPELAGELERLHGALASFRRAEGFGRAIAAPQLGIAKRIVALNLGARPFALINPEITWRSDETFEVWDDCLSVPDTIVRVRRHRSISLRFEDEHGRPRTWTSLPDDMSELVQHEIDHLDGILMTERAIDAESLRPISERNALIGGARPVHRLSLDSIAQAAGAIDPVFTRSPQFECEALSEILGCSSTLKVETSNPIRSFKGRGADWFLTRSSGGEDLICASAGNFGQALAYACRKHARSLVIYASVNANPLKIERMRALGADVRLEGEDFDAAKDAARREAEVTGRRMIEDGREPTISEGAGTIAVELLERGEAYDAVLVPLGNGALLNGMARWIKASSPSTRVLGVCSERARAMERSWRQGVVEEGRSAETIADGIAVRVPIPEAVEDMRGQVDDVLLVDDAAIVEAMQALHVHAGLVSEPAGAVGVAAIRSLPERFAGQRLATVICGSNLTEEQLRRWLGA